MIFFTASAAAGYERGRDDEARAVLRWLREYSDATPEQSAGQYFLQCAIGHLERGEHRKAPEP